MDLNFIINKYHKFFNITCNIGSNFYFIKEKLTKDDEHVKNVMTYIQNLEQIMHEIYTEFKNDPIIKDSTKKENNYHTSAWISDKGIFFPCSESDHIKIAEVLVEQYLGQKSSSNPDEQLLKNSWIKLQHNGYNLHHYTQPTKQQITFLERYLSQNSITEIIINEKIYSTFDHYLNRCEMIF